NEGRWKFPLQKWDELCKMVHGNAATYFRAGWEYVRSMPKAARGLLFDVAWGRDRAEQSIYTSHRQCPTKQYARESCDIMQDMSCHTPQVEADAVALVGGLC